METASLYRHSDFYVLVNFLINFISDLTDSIISLSLSLF